MTLHRTGGEDDDYDADGNGQNHIGLSSPLPPPMPVSPNNLESASTIAHTINTLTSTIADGIVHSVAHWRVILLGQATSIMLAIAGGTNDILALECGVSSPSTYNALGYTLVAIFGFVQLRRNNARKKLGKIGSNSNNHNHVGDEANRGEKEEMESFRGGVNSQEGSHVGDLYLNHDDDEDSYDDVDDLTLDESITKRRPSIFSIRRNNNHQEARDLNHYRSSSGSAKRSSPVLLPPAKWYFYFIVALVEAQAFYFIFLAFRYTSFTFVYVSDALAIPSAMMFSRLFMKRRYLWTHIIGCFICIMGIVVNTASDMNNDNGGGGLKNAVASLDHIKGDIFAIIGAVLLGLDDVLSEMIMDHYAGGVSKMLFMKGIFGAFISLIQLVIFERANVYALFSVENVVDRGDGSTSSSPCELSWRMILLVAHVLARALGVAGEMQFLFISEA